MKFLIQHETSHIQNGWEARSTELRMAAHGHDEEIARESLKKCIESFLMPFSRQGTLEEEVSKIGLTVEKGDPESELEVTLV